jgi:hypothetical protein
MVVILSHSRASERGCVGAGERTREKLEGVDWEQKATDQLRTKTSTLVLAEEQK